MARALGRPVATTLLVLATAASAPAAPRSPRTGDAVVQQAYLKAPAPGTFDTFGFSVAVSGDTAVVGAPSAGAGEVYVFVRNGATWSQQAELTAPGGDDLDNFGASVAISGDTIVVGAFTEDSDATGVDGDATSNDAHSAGAAYVFVRSGTSWSPQAYLKASNTQEEDQFGYRVDVSGDLIVVSAVGEDSGSTGVNGDQSDESASSAGAAYVFARSGTTWSQEAYLKASDTVTSEGPGDRFGESVSIAGDTIVVGAAGEDSGASGVDGDATDNTAESAGAAWVFVRDGTSWSQQAYLKASNTGAGDRLGYAVAVQGDTIAVGAYAEDSAASGVGGDQGDDSAENAGAVYVYVRSGATWTQQAYLKASNPDPADQFGLGVDVDGDRVFVGAQGEDSSSPGIDGDQADDSLTLAGAAYLFGRDGSTWTQRSYVKASNPGQNDRFAVMVAVDDDTLIAGAGFEDSGAGGVNGDQEDDSVFEAGAAYAFVVCDTCVTSAAIVRAGVPPNPLALSTGAGGAPAIGSTWEPVVDHASFLPGAVVDILGISAAPLNIPTSYGTVLCTPPLIALPGAAGVPFSIPISGDCSIAGVSLCIQAASWDGATLAATNALDVTIGTQ